MDAANSQVLVAEAGRSMYPAGHTRAGLVAQLLPTWEEIWRPEESLKLRHFGAEIASAR